MDFIDEDVFPASFVERGYEVDEFVFGEVDVIGIYEKGVAGRKI